MRKPKPLTEGSTLGIVCPASPIPSERLGKGREILHGLGFRTKLGRHVFDRRGWYAGTDEDRARDLMDMFQDAKVHGVICGNGGFGSETLFPHLDFGVLRQNLKVFVGFSNISFLHFMIHRFAFENTIYFPGVSGLVYRSEREDMTVPLDTFVRMVREPDLRLDLPVHIADSPVEAVVVGRVKARLIGGAAVQRSLGTPYEVDCRGKILALELGLESIWWGAHLAHLKNAGKLDEAAGFILPPYDTGEAACSKPEPKDVQTKEDHVNDFIVPLGKPTLVNVPFGHSPKPLPLPLGAMVELDADEKRIRVCEGIVGG